MMILFHLSLPCRLYKVRECPCFYSPAVPLFLFLSPSTNSIGLPLHSHNTTLHLINIMGALDIVKPGVLTGKNAIKLLEYAREQQVGRDE